MDAFVTKTAKPHRARFSTPEPELKQQTITECGGVTSLDVVLPLIETINRYSQLHIVDEVVIGELKRCMEALRGVRMHVEILQDTKIGATINSLRRHSSEVVQVLASELYQNWRASAHDSLTRQVRRRLQHEAHLSGTPSAGKKRHRQADIADILEKPPAAHISAKQARRTLEAEEFIREMAEWDEKSASASKRKAPSTPRNLPTKG